MGPKTLNTINTINEESFVQDYLSESLDAYRAIVDKSPEQSVFMAGWVMRISKLDHLIFGEDT
jgi:hypothetical protein